MKTLCTTLAFVLLSSHAAHAHVTITVNGDQRCIVSDGVPDHETGPWRAGAVVAAQDHAFCMDAMPELTDTITRNVRISGMTITGIPLRPGTAEYYDPSSERGYSRDPSSDGTWKASAGSSWMHRTPMWMVTGCITITGFPRL